MDLNQLAIQSVQCCYRKSTSDHTEFNNAAVKNTVKVHQWLGNSVSLFIIHYEFIIHIQGIEQFLTNILNAMNVELNQNQKWHCKWCRTWLTHDLHWKLCDILYDIPSWPCHCWQSCWWWIMTPGSVNFLSGPHLQLADSQQWWSSEEEEPKQTNKKCKYAYITIQLRAGYFWKHIFSLHLLTP